MAILPIQAATQLLQIAAAGKVAVSAASAASATFADLLQAALSNPSGPHAQESSQPAGESLQVIPQAGNPSSANRVSELAKVADLRKQTAAMIQGFQQHLNQVLAENGIDASSGLHLQLDPLGKIRVAGEHPQKTEIEDLLAWHPELAETLQAIAANSKLLRARDAKTNLHGGEAPNPIAAAVNLPDLFLDGDTAEFDLYVDHRRTQVSFL
jgi:hypothetical protein